MEMSTATEYLSLERCVVRKTAARKGRTRSVEPGKTAARHLNYGRIILDGEDTPLKFETGSHETGLVCLKGSATVKTGDNEYPLNRYDALYLPRDTGLEIQPGVEGCDLAEI